MLDKKIIESFPMLLDEEVEYLRANTKVIFGMAGTIFCLVLFILVLGWFNDASRQVLSILGVAVILGVVFMIWAWFCAPWLLVIFDFDAENCNITTHQWVPAEKIRLVDNLSSKQFAIIFRINGSCVTSFATEDVRIQRLLACAQMKALARGEYLFTVKGQKSRISLTDLRHVLQLRFPDTEELPILDSEFPERLLMDVFMGRQTVCDANSSLRRMREMRLMARHRETRASSDGFKSGQETEMFAQLMVRLDTLEDLYREFQKFSRLPHSEEGLDFALSLLEDIQQARFTPDFPGPRNAEYSDFLKSDARINVEVERQKIRQKLEKLPKKVK